MYFFRLFQFNVNASGDDSDSANDSDFDPQVMMKLFFI